MSAARPLIEETPARPAQLVSLAEFNHARSMKALDRWDLDTPRDPYPFAYVFPRPKP